MPRRAPRLSGAADQTVTWDLSGRHQHSTETPDSSSSGMTERKNKGFGQSSGRHRAAPRRLKVLLSSAAAEVQTQAPGTDLHFSAYPQWSSAAAAL